MTFFSCRLLTTPIFVVFPVFFLNSNHTKYLISFGFHPLDGVTRVVPLPFPSDATGFTSHFGDEISRHLFIMKLVPRYMKKKIRKRKKYKENTDIDK